MRTTVTLEKKMIDELVGETKSKSKASAVREAVSDYLRRKKISRLKTLKGKLIFDHETAARRHHER
jgi:Arc/MetJ-type ribon-helix-helix transcriptional regulator